MAEFEKGLYWIPEIPSGKLRLAYVTRELRRSRFSHREYWFFNAIFANQAYPIAGDIWRDLNIHKASIEEHPYAIRQLEAALEGEIPMTQAVQAIEQHIERPKITA